jgi:hypothetical protein
VTDYDEVADRYDGEYDRKIGTALVR